MIASGSPIDPFVIPNIESDIAPSNRNPIGRAVRSPLLNAGETTLTFITAGQSNIANYTGTTYTPTNASKIDNLNVFDGGMYAATNPVLGSDGSVCYWPLRLADKLITAGTCARVILVPIAAGSTDIAEWGVGGHYNPRLAAAFARCAAHGIPVDAVLWQQGEQDGVDGTTQAAWVAAFNAMVAAERARGNTAPWLVGVSTLVSGTTYSVIQAAQAAVVDNATVFAGGNTDTLTGSTNRLTGLTHLNDTGSDSAATLWKAAIIAAGI